MISDKIKAKIKEHAKLLYPEECCGILALNKEKLLPLRCSNISKDPVNEFIIDPIDYLNCSKQGKIIGIYHSHCIQDNSFSELDKQISHKLNLKNIVYIVKRDTFEEYSPDKYYNKYIDKNFIINESDRLSIVEDYYKEEFGIDIYHYERRSGWDKTTKSL